MADAVKMGKSLEQEIVDLLPTTREWMQQRGWLVYVVEDGERLPHITEEGLRWINGLRNYKNKLDNMKG